MNRLSNSQNGSTVHTQRSHNPQTIKSKAKRQQQQANETINSNGTPPLLMATSQIHHEQHQQSKQTETTPVMSPISHYQNSSNAVTHFDQKSIDIVYGYIRNAQKLLSQQYMSMIPTEICKLCLFNIDDYFMLDQGTFVWKIQGAEFEKFLSTNNGDELVSDIYPLGKLPFVIIVCPNGDSTPTIGSVCIFLDLLSLPSEWLAITVRCSFKVLETGYSSTLIQTYERGEPSTGILKGQTLQEIRDKKFDKITIMIKAHIVKIQTIKSDVCYESKLNFDFKARSKYKYKWELEPILLELMNNATMLKSFESPYFDDMWVLRLFPNGPGTDIQLNITMLPETAVNVKFKWIMELYGDNEIIIHKELWSELNYESYRSSTGNLFTFDELKDILKKYRNISIVLIIEIDDGKDVLREWNSVLHGAKKDDAIQKLNDKFDELRNDMMEMIQRISIQKHSIDKSEVTTGDVAHSNKSDEVYKWLEDIVRLPQYYDIFVDNGFDDMEFIKDVTNEDLQEIGIDKLGHRKRLMKCIDELA